MGYSVIVIDDEIDFLESVRRGLITSGITNVQLESDPRNAASIFEQRETFDVALIDITMPGIDGIELIGIIKATSPDTECIMVTAVDEARTAVECMKKGAYDYLVKPISKEDLVLSVNRALERKRLVDLLNISKKKTPPRLINIEAFKPIVTGSKDVLRVLKEAELHAPSDIPVLITGETGTGKELLARAIHAASPRAKHPFTPVNMESLPTNLFDAQFFGHTKGAFTGAEKAHQGYLEGTNRGTLFLDEIGNLPPEHQGKLLRVLQDGEYIKIGTNKPRKADVRFIAATNADLEKLVIKKAFRKDLYYRLRGGWLHLPSLRERRDDIPLLVNMFIEDCSGLGGESIREEALSLLLDYNYPGNIRELRAIIQSAVNLAQGAPISAKALPEYLQKQMSRLKQPSTSQSISPLAEVEKGHILEVYDRLDKNKSQTARALGIGLNTLRRKLESYGID
jgi:two-component system response regulator AtoC